MATKVKALQTIAGDYGIAHEGEELEVRDSNAKELEKAGLVKIVGSTSTKEDDSFRASNLTKTKAAEGIVIHDETQPQQRTLNVSGKASTEKAAPAKSSVTVSKASSKKGK